MSRERLKKAAAAGDLVLELLRQRGLEGKVEEYRAWQVWDEVVGPQIASRAQPVRIREGVLEVRVEQAVWMQQLQLLKPKILGRLNERLGRALIRDIFWRRGRLELSPSVAAAATPDWRTAELDAAEEREIAQMTAAIPDPELRQALADFLSRQKCLDKARKTPSEDHSSSP